MQQLVSDLNEASDAYYNGRSELMTDYEWDQRFDELKRLESETGTILPDSPTQKVSEDSITGQKEEHEFAALSLAKTKQISDLVKWAEARPIWISWKLDGLTLVVTYDGGRLTKVVTRGNGHIGTNITHLSRSINGIPQEIKAKGHTVIRGEAVISYDDFERFVMESGEDYANPRNLASGSLTLKDPDEVKARHI
jgi:DNA ligase (NAD+)